MRRYGGLSPVMPITFLTFAMGYLAIIGFPGFSGFWSKDRIIESALAVHWTAGVAAMIGAGITAFYMTRVVLMTFLTPKRWDEDAHPHESAPIMTTPLVVLAALSVVGGVLTLSDWIEDWLVPVVGEEHHELGVPVWVITLAIVATVAYLLTGHRGIYPSQRIARLKHGGPLLDRLVPLRELPDERPKPPERPEPRESSRS